MGEALAVYLDLAPQYAFGGVGLDTNVKRAALLAELWLVLPAEATLST